MKNNTKFLCLLLCIISISNYSCTKGGEESPSIEKNYSTNRKTGSYSSSPTFTVKWDDNSTAVFYESTSNSDEYQINLYDNSGNLDNTIIGSYTSVDEYVRLHNLTGTLLYEHPYTNPNTNHVNGYPGDCAKLGARRSGESYSDCFERNWDNFCCDFVGCIAQDTQPHWIAVAIAISCGFKDGKITEVYDNNNDVILYD